MRRLGAVLPLADGLDLDHFQAPEAVTVVEQDGALALEPQTRDEPRLALSAIERLSDLFELEFGRMVRPIPVRVA